MRSFSFLAPASCTRVGLQVLLPRHRWARQRKPFLVPTALPADLVFASCTDRAALPSTHFPSFFLAAIFTRRRESRSCPKKRRRRRQTGNGSCSRPRRRASTKNKGCSAFRFLPRVLLLLHKLLSCIFRRRGVCQELHTSFRVFLFFWCDDRSPKLTHSSGKPADGRK